MINHDVKTVPYRLSAAELENLRLLRRRANPSSPDPDEKEEEKLTGETHDWNPDSGRFNQKVEKRTL